MSTTRNISRALFTATLCSGLVLSACKEDSADKSSGVSVCDDYVAAMESCLEKIPKDQRGPMKKQLETQQDALAKAAPAAKEQMADGCRTGLATLNADGRCK